MIIDDELRAMYFAGKLAEKDPNLGRAISAYMYVTQWPEQPFYRKALAKLAAANDMLGRDVEALTFYGMLIRLHPYDAEALAGYVPLLLRNGRMAEAVHRLLDAMCIVPLQAWAIRKLGDVYAEADLRDLAHALWREADLLEPTGGSHPKAA